MATYYSNEMRAVADSPRNLVGNEAIGGRIRIYRATIPLDAPSLTSTTAGAGVTTSDTIVLAKIPAGYRFVEGRMTSTVSLGSSTVAIGITGSAGKYRAAATFTATNTPTPFGVGAALAAGPLAAEEEVFATIAAADLPTTAGAKLVIDLYVAGP